MANLLLVHYEAEQSASYHDLLERGVGDLAGSYSEPKRPGAVPWAAFRGRAHLSVCPMVVAVLDRLSGSEGHHGSLRAAITKPQTQAGRPTAAVSERTADVTVKPA